MRNPLFQATITGLTAYMAYPPNDSLHRLGRRWPWLQYVFLFFLVWQGRGEQNITRSLIAVGIIYALLQYAVPALERL